MWRGFAILVGPGREVKGVLTSESRLSTMVTALSHWLVSGAKAWRII